MNYPGGKNGAGCYQWIVNHIPPHEVYIEPFAGSAAILRAKRPALRSYACDRDAAAIAALRGAVPDGTELLTGDGIAILETWPLGRECFVYADPPYLMETRTSGPLYRFEMTAADHRRFLRAAVKLRCPIAISGYWSSLYARFLKGWRLVTRPQMTRAGTQREECLWMNYPQGDALHDYRYLGRNYREREKFTRRQRRWKAKLAKMEILERRALLSAISESSEAAGENGLDRPRC